MRRGVSSLDRDIGVLGVKANRDECLYIGISIFVEYLICIIFNVCIYGSRVAYIYRYE